VKGWVAVRSPSGPTFDLKFFPCDYSCGFAKIFVKSLNCCINMLLLCIADIIGIYKDFLNKKGKRNKDFEALYYVWQGVQKYQFAKSQEKPHKTVNFQVQCGT